jgi:transposase InsO family protein
VLTDNAMRCRRGQARIAVCAQLGISRRFIQPGRPWTNGNAEQFNLHPAGGAYVTRWTSSAQRTTALDG